MVAPTTRPYISAPMTRRFTRLAWTAATVSGVVAALGGYAWCLRRDAGYGMRDAEAPGATRAAHPPSRIPHPDRPGVAAYVGLMLLVLQVGLGAVTVKLSLPPW